MKHIYTNILTALKEIPELKWIDLDKGQMNSNRPSVAFPAALITVTLPRTENITSTIQTVNTQITVRLCFDYTGSTNSKMTEAARNKSLEYFNIADKVFNKLQNLEADNMNALERINAIEEVRPDGYKILAQTYNSGYKEELD